MEPIPHLARSLAEADTGSPRQAGERRMLETGGLYSEYGHSG
jgi:hypothetical protein